MAYSAGVELFLCLKMGSLNLVIMNDFWIPSDNNNFLENVDLHDWDMEDKKIYFHGCVSHVSVERLQKQK
jgi:hypothetical protein